MKKLYFALLATCLLTACKPATQPADGSGVSADSLQKSFLAISQGNWVLNEYIAEIEKTHSPLKAADKLQGVVAMMVDADVKGDSLEILASWNNHEGYSFETYFRPGTQPHTLLTNMHDTEHPADSYELSYETVNGTPQLSLLHYDKAHALLDRHAFTKVADGGPENDVSWALQAVVNDKLIAGTFAVHDSSKNAATITLNRDGSCSGYGDFKSYYVFTDFLGGPVPTFDEMAFNMMQENDRRYAVDFKQDTILLYNMVGVEEEGSLKRDKLKLTLVRR